MWFLEGLSGKFEILQLNFAKTGLKYQDMLFVN